MIDADRPDQTECTSTAPKGWFQVENGFIYSVDTSGISHSILPSSLWKIGVNDHFELRMISEPQSFRSASGQEFGLSPLRFGFKSRLVEGKKWIPNISFISHLSVPMLSTENLRGINYNPDFRFTLDNELSDKLTLGYNIGMRWDDENPKPFFQYTMALGYEISQKWKCYVELYGDKPQDENFELATSGGIYYYPVPNWMIDVTASYGIANTDLRYYTALGISFLIPYHKRDTKALK